jgi:hypothetical protein
VRAQQQAQVAAASEICQLGLIGMGLAGDICVLLAVPAGARMLHQVQPIMHQQQRCS